MLTHESILPTRTPEEISAVIGSVVAVGGVVTPSWRSWRWVAELPGDRMAFVAEDGGSWARLCREQALLERLVARVRFSVPRTEAVAPKKRVQVRRRLAGLNGLPVEHIVFGRADVPASLRYGNDSPITVAGTRLARDLGRALANLQRAVSAVEVSALGFPTTSYSAMLAAIEQQLAERPELADIAAALPSLTSWFATLPSDDVLAHSDLQLHNLACDPITGALAGVFDFDAAGVAHRLEDFKYLPSFGLAFCVAALEEYTAAGAASLKLADIGRFHVLSALEHFLFVPDDSPRRHEIIAWTRDAIAHFHAFESGVEAAQP